jgi:ABC-2 type transport system permease protein
MPDAMQKLANFVPQKWTIEAITNLASGDTLTDIRLHLAILLLFAVVLLAFGSVALRPGETVEE